MNGGVGARLPLSARVATASASTSPRHRALRPPPPRATGPHALLPPRDRLRALRRECVALDRELKVLESSGHNRVGIFARPLVMQVHNRPVSETPEKLSYLADDSAAANVAPETDEECRDPFFHQFYDDEGQSLFEQLLRARMRGLALAKLAFGTRSIATARAEVELAEAYARLNLWKQGYPHVTTARSVLKTLDEGSSADKEAKEAERSSSRASQATNRNSVLSRALAYFYDLESDETAQGQVGLAVLAGYVQLWRDEIEHGHGDNDALEPEASRLLDHDSLVQAFDSSPTIHWQVLLARLEHDNAPMKDYISSIERVVPPAALRMLRETFAALDEAGDGIVPHIDLVSAITQERQQLRFALYQHETGSSDAKSDVSTSRCLHALVTALKHRRRQVEWPTITWSEVLELGCSRHGFRLGQSDPSDASDDDDDDDNDDESESRCRLSQVLNARIDLFLSRVFLRRGQLDDAVRSILVAVAAQERACEDAIEPGDTLVPFYLAAAEVLAVRSKQLRARSQQAALDQVERWLQSVEGTRGTRARALSLMDAHCQRSGGHILTKKDAEAQARAQLRQERIATTTGSAAIDATAVSFPPDALAMLDEAVEYCNKAWSLLEQHLGREHVATAAVHTALAQLHLTKGESDECVRCYARAAAVYETACNGPVPASALIQLEIARVHHQRAFQLAKTPPADGAASAASAARRAYLAAGEFFCSFGREFPGVSSTRRDCCALALDALRQWLLLARGGEAAPSTARQQQQPWPACSLEEQRHVLARVHEAAVDGYGEFSIEASDAARELAKALGRLGGDANASAGVVLLRSALTVYESHFGAADRRSRVVRKEAHDARRSLSGKDKPDEMDGDDWLTL